MYHFTTTMALFLSTALISLSPVYAMDADPKEERDDHALKTSQRQLKDAEISPSHVTSLQETSSERAILRQSSSRLDQRPLAFSRSKKVDEREEAIPSPQRSLLSSMFVSL